MNVLNQSNIFSGKNLSQVTSLCLIDKFQIEIVLGKTEKFDALMSANKGANRGTTNNSSTTNNANANANTNTNNTTTTQEENKQQKDGTKLFRTNQT